MQAAPTLLLWFGILLLASGLGFSGVAIGFAFMLAHILSLRSFGLCQLASDRKVCQHGIISRYNAIKGTGNALVLPDMRCVQNDEETVVEGSGVALFQGDRATGFLTPKQTKFYLFVVDKIEGGVLSFPSVMGAFTVTTSS